MPDPQPDDATKARPPVSRRVRDWLERNEVAIGKRALDLVALGLTAFVFLTLNRRFYWGPIGFDEEFFVWGGWSIKKGLVPYRDFLEFKPPMLFITHYVALALFGLKDAGYRIFFAAFPLLSVLALQVALVARGVGRFFAAAVMVGFVALFVNPAWHDTGLTDAESIGIAYYLLGLACLLWEGRFIKVTTLLGGLFMACCVLSKEPFAPVVGFTGLTMFWLRRPGASRWESRKLYAKYSLAGVALLVLALCVYLVPTGAIKGYAHLLFGGYRKMFRNAATSYCVAFGAADAEPQGGMLLDDWRRLRLMFFKEDVLAYLLPIALPGAVFTFRRSKVLFALTGLALLAALAAPMMSRCLWPHYFSMAMAGVIFVLVVGVDSMKAVLRRASPATRRTVTAAALLLVCLHAWPALDHERDALYTRRPWDEPQAGLLEFIKTNTAPSDRIFTTGAPLLYAMADRLSAVRESTFIDPILASLDGASDREKLRPIFLQLVKNKPKVVFMDGLYEERKPRITEALMKPFLTEFKYKQINERLYLRP
jgi:hypothetical protein